MSAAGSILIDGEERTPESAVVSVFDRGFLYGDSVFETLRTYAGRIFALSEHLERLAESAARVKLPLPISLSEFAEEAKRAVSSSGAQECYVRITLTRGQGTRLGLSPQLANRPLRVVMALPLEPLPEEKYERGITAVTFRTQRVADGTDAAGAKLGNYLVSVLAMDIAQRAGAEEALLVDNEARILEGASSNVFAVSGGKLLTPPLSFGILAGITRSRVLLVARELGIPVGERALLKTELANLEELFISSSIRELLPVVRVDGSVIGNGRPGALTQRLLAAFRAHARAT